MSAIHCHYLLIYIYKLNNYYIYLLLKYSFNEGKKSEQRYKTHKKNSF